MRVNVLFRLFSVCILLLDTISPFESHLLFDLSLKFAVLYGNAILKQCKNVPTSASKEEFTSKQLYTPFQTSLDSRCLNSSVLLCVNCLLTTVFVLLFFLSIFISTICARWSERPKSTTTVLNTGISLYVMITSIRDSVEGVILVGDLNCIRHIIAL